MNKTFAKEIVRSVTHSWSRFWAIFAIVALGSGFYAGLRATAPNMRLTGDAYYDQAHMMDLHLVSTLGFSGEDVEAIRNTPGVGAVMAGYSVDAISRMEGKDQVIRIHSLPSDHGEENGDSLNRPELVEGRWPENDRECILDAEASVKLGDTVTLEDRDGSLSDSMNSLEFQVVGLAHTAYYFSFSLGSTTMGSGTLNNYMFVLDSAFQGEVFTDLFAVVQGARELDAFSDSYRETVDPVQKALEDLAPERLEIRYDLVVGEARRQLDEARAEYNQKREQAEQQLAQAEQELEEGRARLSQERQRLAQAEEELEKGVQQLEEAQQTLDQGLVQLAAGQRQLDTAAKQLEEGKKDWESGVRQLAEQRVQINRQLEDAKIELATREQQLQSAKQQLNEAQSALAESERLIAALREEIAKGEAQLDQITDPTLKEELERVLAWSREKLNQVEQTRLDALKEIEAQMAQIAQAEPLLEAAKKEYDEKSIQAQVELTLAQQKLDAASQTLALSEAELTKNQMQLAQSQKELQQGQAELTENRQKLSDSKAQIEQGKQQLAQAQVDLEVGQREYDAKKQDAHAKLEDAENQLRDNERKLEEMADPQWYVLDRDTNVGFASFRSDTDRMDSLSAVFPLFFFLVAALVALTTMTRMVEEERVLIGTYKALGYNGLQIAGKYILYASAACLSGCAAGILAGSYLLPVICWNAYRILYIGPDLLLPFRWDLALGACGASLFCTLAATLSSCWATLRESPSLLMQPRAPKPGKRIFLEHIPFVWNRMGFTRKVTARNLFRYKKRLIMTVVGIAGCTALLLTGYGIKDSISGILSNQFEQINQYNTTIELKDPEIPEKLSALLQNPDYFSDYLEVSRQSEELTNEGTTMTATLVIPKETDALKRFLTLRSRVGHEDVAFDQDSVVLTEKLADRLSLHVGDRIRLKNPAGNQVELSITGITEHYIQHAVYISPELYEEKMGGAPSYTGIFGVSTAQDTEERNALSESLQEIYAVSTVTFSEDVSAQFITMIDSLNLIIVVIIICAGLLAFVVLYNLTNINITERQREIATIKVLGFFDREVSAYVYRETAVLTVLGCALGLGMGMLLHAFVIQTVEVDMVMFGRAVAPLSYLWASLLTILFSVLVNLVMFRKLKRISMVESLKSVE